MLDHAITCSDPGLTLPEPERESNLWAIVLAGGEGRRLRALTRYLYGEERPKQYAVLTGSKSLLRQTLERVTRLVPPSRIVVAAQASHDRYLDAELAGFPSVHVLAQPSNRGTAAGVLTPAHWIRARDPHAVVTVFPADHFMRHVGEVATYVRARPDGLVLLGVPPSDPDPDYGWIEPGPRVGWAGADPVWRIRGFREKPTEESARQLFALGALWNTFVLATRAEALIEAGRRCLPLLHDRLVRMGLFAGTRYETWALRQAYLFAPTADFSRTVLESPALDLSVAEVPTHTWCDLGTPARVAWTLRALGAPPPAWIDRLGATS
jgi:mannose-1-phosphate guanylyltransferase